MKQIVSKEQMASIRIGSILVNRTGKESTGNRNDSMEPEHSLQYVVSGFTPIGWEDTEFELNSVNTGLPAFAESDLSVSPEGKDQAALNILASELLTDRKWWIKH